MPVSERAMRFNEDVTKLRDIGTTHSNMGSDILKTLWDIFKDNLYSTEEFVYVTDDREIIGQRFESFVELCDEAIRSFYDPADYFDKFKWVVERVFRYVHIRAYEGNPIIIPFTEEELTVERLLEQKGWISKLIIISNKIASCTTNEQVDSLFFAGFTEGVEEVIQAGNDIQNDRIPIRIPVIERPLANSRYTLEVRNIDEEQYDIIRRRMGKIFDYHLD